MELTLWYTGEVEPKDTEGSCVTTPTLKDAVSAWAPVATVMVLVWTVAVGAMVRVAVAVVRLVTATLLTVMPEPAGKLAAVVFSSKPVFSPVMVTGTDWPCIPDAGAKLMLCGSGVEVTGGVEDTGLLEQPEHAKVSRNADKNSEIFFIFCPKSFPAIPPPRGNVGRSPTSETDCFSTAWRVDRKPVVTWITILIACERAPRTSNEPIIAAVC
jgi:hypothetical protein